MPEERSRPGLVENAGGSLRCPVEGCRETRLEMVAVTVYDEGWNLTATSHTYQVTHSGVPQGLRRVALSLYCPRGHAFNAILGATDTGIRAVTEWEEPE